MINLHTALGRRRLSRPYRLTFLLAVLITCGLPTACARVNPSPTVTPIDQVVQTRVAATLTALASATLRTPLPSPSDTGLPTMPPPTPSQTAPAPTPTLPPEPSPTPSGTPAPTEAPTPTSTASPVITHWRGEYYANRELSGNPAVVRNDVVVDFDWGQSAAVTGLPVDDFAARWTRSLDLEGATYRFYVFVDDGARLWVDDELLINAWYDSSARTLTAERPVVRGTHRIKLEYYEHSGTALVRMWWEKVQSYADWKGEYWSNRSLDGSAALVRNDSRIDFYWGQDSPAVGLPTDNFAARWTRTVKFDGATYRFRAFVDDGVRVWVDGLPVIDAWYDYAAHEVTADYALVAGNHHVRVEYYEHTGNAQVRVSWDKVLSPSYPDWKGEYWSNRSMTGAPALVRNDPRIEFDWGSKGPAPLLPEDNFAVRWSRTVDFETGLYRFTVRSDDGIRVFVDGEPVLDEWHDGGQLDPYRVDWTLSGRHELVVEYYEHAGLARVAIQWTRIQAGPPRN
jgi:hypothetical protein